MRTEAAGAVGGQMVCSIRHEESDMVDPTEMKKGGFGAAAAMRRDQQAARDIAEQAAKTAASNAETSQEGNRTADSPADERVLRPETMTAERLPAAGRDPESQ